MELYQLSASSAYARYQDKANPYVHVMLHVILTAMYIYQSRTVPLLPSFITTTHMA